MDAGTWLDAPPATGIREHRSDFGQTRRLWTVTPHRRQWESKPTLLNGVPVPVAMTVTVNFKPQ